MASPLKDKPRLTEQEKKNNHIASEQKRRQAIREGFDRLADLTPGYEGQGRSENIVLQAALVHMNKNLDDYKALVEEAKSRGIDVSDVEIPGVEEGEPSASGEQKQSQYQTQSQQNTGSQSG
jgi:heteromeric Ino2p/Ino4p transcription factor